MFGALDLALLMNGFHPLGHDHVSLSGNDLASIQHEFPDGVVT
jgi:hypothetical protein